MDDATATAIGLALHELATNSVKFGALAMADGRISVLWSRHDEAEVSRVVLTWEEQGRAVQDTEHSGFGREFIERGLPYELGATSTLQIGPDGVVCRIDIPLRHDQELQADQWQ
jgi:two-component sensor histidine kinase